MKLKSKIATFAAIGLMGYIFTGCSTDAPPNVTTSPVTQLVAETIVSDTTLAVLSNNKNNPQLVNDFAVGATVLSDLSGSTNDITPAEADELLVQGGSTNTLVNSMIVNNVTTFVDTYEGSATNAVIPSATLDLWLQWDAAGIRNALNTEAVQTAQ
jgi:hypothetical protein